MMISGQDFQAAGLYDPHAEGAAERLRALQWLVERGATLEQIRAAEDDGSLVPLATELGRGSPPKLSITAIAEACGMSEAQISETLRVLGLGALLPDHFAMTEAEARSLAVFREAGELFGPRGLRRFNQVIGSATARIAEAAMALNLSQLLKPMHQARSSEVAVMEARYRAASSIAPLSQVLAYVFRAQTQIAARRTTMAHELGQHDVAPMAVGFLDLVGFTTLSRQMGMTDLAAMIDRFEETAHDVTTSRNGRVVKFIGDEVMFATYDAAEACDIALSLIESFADDDLVRPRGAVAFGDVLVRAGDYYGPVVNLAARAASAAVPDEVLVTEAVAESVGQQFILEPAGRRQLRGFDEPVRMLALGRVG